MIKALVEYINSRGRTAVKGFTTIDEAMAFCKKLDSRISKGTCGGYILTVI